MTVVVVFNVATILDDMSMRVCKKYDLLSTTIIIIDGAAKELLPPWTENSSKGKTESALALYKYMTLPMGIWPLPTNRDLFAKLRFFVAMVCQVLLLVFQSNEVLVGCNDAATNLESLILISCNLVGSAKAICYRLYSKNMLRNFESVVKDYETTNQVEYYAILTRHANIAKRISTALIAFTGLSTVGFFVRPLLVDVGDKTLNEENGTEFGEALPYPFPSVCTFGTLKVSPTLHLLIYLLHMLLTIPLYLCNIGGDCLFFCITFHMCGQVEILKHKFAKLDLKGIENRNGLDTLVIRYDDLLSLAKLIFEPVNKILLIQLMVSCLFICITGFQLIISIEHNDLLMIVKTFNVLFSLLVQLFAYSCVGEYLQCQMEDIGYAAYQSTWYEFPIEWAKHIVFIITRSQRVVQLAAGNFFAVNMESFMSILKTSFSYLSVLHVMVQT